ncbi:hypothetical protein EU522_01360 [Candidatus Thorarchaeota archaeon]|nr:MAG: hypothetical protein EU522_01360 [Candidatus Thorarchaeota archaeon]
MAFDGNTAQNRDEAVIRFIGSLLGIASRSDIHYDWFTGAISRFERELGSNISKNGVISFKYVDKRIHKGD